MQSQTASMVFNVTILYSAANSPILSVAMNAAEHEALSGYNYCRKHNLQIKLPKTLFQKEERGKTAGQWRKKYRQ